MDEAGEEDVGEEGAFEEKSPSSQFRSKVTVKEEVIEIEPGEEEFIAQEEVTYGEDTSAKEKEADVTEETETETVGEVVDAGPVQENNPDLVMIPNQPSKSTEIRSERSRAIAQPFLGGGKSYAAAAAEILAPKSARAVEEEEVEESADAPPASEEQQRAEAKPEVNLNELEKEKERLQQLLSKLANKQRLEQHEASIVADAYIRNLSQSKAGKSVSSAGHSASSTPKHVAPGEATERVLEEASGAQQVLADPEPAVVESEELVQEETIVEEEVAISDENVPDVAVDVTGPRGETAGTDSAAEAAEAGNAEVEEAMLPREQPMDERRLRKEQKKKDKEQRSLIRRHFKEKERHKRRVEQMRVPGQKVISALEDNEENVVDEEDNTLGPSGENRATGDKSGPDRGVGTSGSSESPMSLAKASEGVRAKLSVDSLSRTSSYEEPGRESSASSAQSFQTAGRGADDGRSSKTLTPVSGESPASANSPAAAKAKLSRSAAFVQSLTPNSAADKSLDDATRMAPPTRKTPLSASPYTSKSSSHDKSSHPSRKGNSSDSPSPLLAKQHRVNQRPEHSRRYRGILFHFLCAMKY